MKSEKEKTKRKTTTTSHLQLTVFFFFVCFVSLSMSFYHHLLQNALIHWFFTTVPIPTWIKLPPTLNLQETQVPIHKMMRKPIFHIPFISMSFSMTSTACFWVPQDFHGCFITEPSQLFFFEGIPWKRKMKSAMRVLLWCTWWSKYGVVDEGQCGKWERETVTKFDSLFFCWLCSPFSCTPKMLLIWWPNDSPKTILITVLTSFTRNHP